MPRRVHCAQLTSKTHVRSFKMFYMCKSYLFIINVSYNFVIYVAWLAACNKWHLARHHHFAHSAQHKKWLVGFVGKFIATQSNMTANATTVLRKSIRNDSATKYFKIMMGVRPKDQNIAVKESKKFTRQADINYCRLNGAMARAKAILTTKFWVNFIYSNLQIILMCDTGLCHEAD